MEEQPGREFASADPTAGAQDATFQERPLCTEIPLNACRRLQHLQRPAPSDFSPNAPHASHCGDEHVARGCRGSLKIRVAPSARALSHSNVTTPERGVYEK